MFIQRAGVVAVTEGDSVIAHTRQRYRKARDFLEARLHSMPEVEAGSAPGAMYAFFRVRGVDRQLRVLQAPRRRSGSRARTGFAFGPEGEGFVRWCFAASEDRLADGIDRLQRFLGRPGALA